jgi:hypothetical protein
MGRMIFFAGCWFAVWMIAGALVGLAFAPPQGGAENGVYFGAMNGAWVALLTSFVWPWLMPRVLERWLDNKV